MKMNKKIIWKIAMILILVMCVNMFTGCSGVEILLYAGGAILVLFLIYTIPQLIIEGVADGIGNAIDNAKDRAAKERRGEPRRTNPYSYEVSSALKDKIDTLPQEDTASIGAAFDSVPTRELNSFYARIDGMSEARWVSTLEAVNSFSVQELSVIIETVNSMSEEEIASQIKEINSLPQDYPLALIIREIEVDFSEEEPYVVGYGR